MDSKLKCVFELPAAEQVTVLTTKEETGTNEVFNPLSFSVRS